MRSILEREKLQKVRKSHLGGTPFTCIIAAQKKGKKEKKRRKAEKPRENGGRGGLSEDGTVRNTPHKRLMEKKDELGEKTMSRKEQV